MTQRVSTNSVHGAVAWAIPVLLGFIVTPLLVSGLGIKGYGVYSLVVGIIQYSFNLQFGRLMTHYVARAHGGEEPARKLCSSTVLLAVLIALTGSLIIAILSSVIVDEVFRVSLELRAEAVTAVRLSSVVLMSMAVLYLSWSVLQGLGHFALFAKLSGVYSISISFSAILIALSGGTIAWIFISQILVTILFIGITIAILRHLNVGVYFFERPDRGSIEEVVRGSVPVIGYQVVGNAVVLIERGLVSARLGEAALSFYVVAMNLAINLHGLAASLSLSILPYASNRNRDWDSFRNTYEKATTYIIALMTGITTTVVIFGEQILRVWLGPEFGESATAVLIPGVIAFGLHAFSVVAFQVVDGTGRSRLNLLTTFASGVVFTAVAVGLIGTLGIAGPAFGRLASSGVWLVFMLLIDRGLRGSLGGRFFGGITVRLSVPVITCLIFGNLFQEYFHGSWASLLLGMLMTTICFGIVSTGVGVIRFRELRELLTNLLPYYRS